MLYRRNLQFEQESHRDLLSFPKCLEPIKKKFSFTQEIKCKNYLSSLIFILIFFFFTAYKKHCKCDMIGSFYPGEAKELAGQDKKWNSRVGGRNMWSLGTLFSSDSTVSLVLQWTLNLRRKDRKEIIEEWLDRSFQVLEMWERTFHLNFHFTLR